MYYYYYYKELNVDGHAYTRSIKASEWLPHAHTEEGNKNRM